VANIVKPKRSYSPGNTPTLVAGEFGINAPDGKMWIGNGAGTANILIASLSRSDHTGTLATTAGGTGITTYTTGDLIYSSASNTLAKLTGNTTTTKQFLSQTGSGSASAAPAWSTVSKSDVGLGSVENTALSTWAGSSNVNTLGTITSGTWNSSTKIGLAYGGTNASITATNGGVIYSTASALAVSAAGTSGQILKSNGAAAPTWMSTSSITSVGTLTGLAVTETVTTDNTVTITGVASQTGKLLLLRDALANDLFSVDYSGSATTVGLTVNGMTYPGTDGSSGQVLSTNGAGTLSWTTPTSAAAGTTGDIQYNDGSGTITASSYFSYGSSAYDQLALYSNNGAFGLFGIFAASGQTYPLLEFRDYLGTTVYSYFDATGNLYLNAQTGVNFADADSSNYIAIKSPTTVSTNYTLTLPTTAGTSGYVMTTNGSGTLSWTNATNANTASAIVKRDASGNFSAGTITATLSGNATNVSGTVAIANGGTGQATATAAFNALAPSQTSNSGKYLTTNGTNASWAAVTSYTESATVPASPAVGDRWLDTGNGLLFIYSNDGTSSQWVEWSNPSILSDTTISSSGRLTLESGVPISTSDQTSKTTIYFTPYNGDRISLYNGTTWANYTFTERSLALGTLTSGKNYDVFLYDNSGTLTLELTAWTSDTARATSLTLTNGIYLKTGALTRRYLGTIRTTSTTTTEDSMQRRFVWNLNNQVERLLYKNTYPTYAYTGHAYSTASWRAWNGDSSMAVYFVIGIDRSIILNFSCASSGAYASQGAAFDGASPGYDSVDVTGRGGRAYSPRTSSFVGYHYCTMYEFGTAGATQIQAILEGSFWC